MINPYKIKQVFNLIKTYENDNKKRGKKPLRTPERVQKSLICSGM